jgi:hypothetical protein
MRTQSTPVAVETQFGTLYVAVACADPHSYHDSERGNVTDLRPELWVATDAGFEADPGAADHWTIRGRAYALHYQVIRERGEWHRNHAPYGGGFRNDRRGQVEFRTKTWDQMWAATIEGLNAFHQRTPGWEGLSVYMLHAADESGARGRAETARREAEQHDKTAAGHGALKDKAGAGMAPDLMALLNGN